MGGRHRRDRQLPRHVQDQVDASMAEVVEVMEATAASLGVTIEHGPDDDPRDPTLTGLIARIKSALLAREAKSCGHTASPQPLFLNAWDDPFMVRCLACHRQLTGLSGDDDVRCDTCGHVDRTGVWPAQIALGPLVVSMGRCDSCTPEHIRNRP